MRGKCRYSDKEGNYIGFFYKDDPIIRERDLVPQYTENNRKQLEMIRGLAAEALSGTSIYNNGVVEARFVTQPDDPQWKLGRMKRSDEWNENHRNAVISANLDHLFYNNGEITVKVHKDELPPLGFVPGMAPKAVIDLKRIGVDVPTEIRDLTNHQLYDAFMSAVRDSSGKIVHARFKRTYLMKHAPDLVKELMYRTSESADKFNLTQRLVLMMYDVDHHPKCIVCGDQVSIDSGSKKISDVCSPQCANKHPLKSERTKKSWNKRRNK
jgi:predicted nucleic acid-binding Zn ribbon protein